MPLRILIGWLLSCLLLSQVHAESIWDAIRDEFKLNHELSQPEVQTELRWLLAHPGFVHKVTTQSKPYIYHILTEIKKRNLPGEMALLPMIESAYDPFAYSGAGAAGLWQLMPATGNNLGLKQDWWKDSRRSIGDSTNAALNYLTRLNRFFAGNWLLTIAAYDAGEGTIAKTIKLSGQGRSINFWRLPVPNETKGYVPRLLALAEIIGNPRIYHISLPDIPFEPYFEEVDVGSQIDLSSAAKLAGIPYKDLIKLNPGFNRWATAPYKPFKLLIPTDKVEDFSKNLKLVPDEKRVSFMRYHVRNNDSLSGIAQKYHTTTNLIKELNQMPTNAVKKGQVVMIPSPKNTPISVQATNHIKRENHFNPGNVHKILHIVQKQDTTNSIAKRYGVTPGQLYQWNNLKPGVALKANQQLFIYKAVIIPKRYTVQKGDTLGGIAQKHHTSVRQILVLNPQIKRSLIKPGQTINV